MKNPYPLLFVALLVLNGCATQPSLPINYYQPPDTRGTATIVGEDNSTIPLLFDNNTIFIALVDGLPVREPRTTGKIPIAVPAGLCRVSVAQQLGAFFGGASFEFEAKPDMKYRVRYQQDLEGTNFFNRPLGPAGGPTFFWIEELESGARITSQVRVQVTTGNRATPIPIFIPKGK
jgi:hypothetical protein